MDCCIGKCQLRRKKPILTNWFCPVLVEGKWWGWHAWHILAAGPMRKAKTIVQVARKFYWLHQDVASLCRTCELSRDSVIVTFWRPQWFDSQSLMSHFSKQQWTLWDHCHTATEILHCMPPGNLEIITYYSALRLCYTIPSCSHTEVS